MAESETLVMTDQTSGIDEDANRDEDKSMADAPNPRDDSDSDSNSASASDSDSDSEGEARVNEQIETLEKVLKGKSPDYDSHAQYIKLLRKQGEIEKLRQAREAMSSVFPLSPDMWQEWAKDETTATSGEETLPTVEKLYERGVSDYLSVDLWCDYLNFVQEHDPSVRECSTSGISKARNLFERALTATGLHVAEGHRIWELYREFEQAIFLTIEETDSAAKEKQIQRIRNLFHRQLSIPLADLKSTLLSYKAWEAEYQNSTDANGGELDGLSSHVVSVYNKALDMLNARSLLEEKIFRKEADSEKLQDYMTYVEFEHAFGDPARIQILHERAIADFPVSADLWIDYTQYLDKTFKTSKIGRDAYYRATRNCPWVGELWVRYLLALERNRSSEEELSTVFERALLCSFSSYDEYLNLFLTRVDGVRRRMCASKQSEDGLDYAIIRDVFQRASNYLSVYLSGTPSLLHLFSYWARLELNLGKDLIAARGVWDRYLKSSGTLEVWQGYIAWEIETGHINEARSLYKRCYSKRFPGTGSEDICHSWVRFEREYGSLEDYDFAVQKVAPRLQELQLFRLQQEGTYISPPTNEKEKSSGKNTREKRKPTSSLINEQSSEKRPKNTAQNLKKTKDDKGQVRLSTEVTEATELGENKAKCVDTQESKGKSSKKPLPFDDQCTAFISNLNLRTTDADLQKFFADVGGVVAVRILKDKFTKKSRGLAYVDFADDAHLAAALKKNKQMLMGKKLSILKSDPQQGQKKRDIRLEHGKKDFQEASKGKSGQDRKDNVELKGKNTFAVPRNVVKPLGWSHRNEPKSDHDQEDENPKSNDEFRKMFMKSDADS